jgi:hypothetical protein
MSGKSRTRNNNQGNPVPPALRPEALRLLDCAEAAFRILDPAAKRLGNDVGFRTDAGYTVFRVQPVNEATHSGLHTGERLMLHTTLPAGTPLSDADLVKANLMAGIGAVVRKPETGELVILSSAVVGAGDDDTLNFLGELFLRSAPDHGAGVARLFVDSRSGSADEPAPDAVRPWGPQEFAAARDTLVARGIPVELSPGLLDARPPGGPALPEPLSGIFPSCRLMLSTHEPHPWLGNGLAVVLKLPKCCEPADAERLVNQLNWWEWCALDGPPFVGAWTSLPEKGEPVFVTFVADEAWHPQLVGSLVDWALRRADVVQRWVVNWWE